MNPQTMQQPSSPQVPQVPQTRPRDIVSSFAPQMAAPAIRPQQITQSLAQPKMAAPSVPYSQQTQTAFQPVRNAIGGAANSYANALQAGNQQISQVSQKMGGIDPLGFVGSTEYIGGKGAKLGFKAGTDLLNMIEEHAPKFEQMVKGKVNLDAMDFMDSLKTRLTNRQHVSTGEASTAHELLQSLVKQGRDKVGRFDFKVNKL